MQRSGLRFLYPKTGKIVRKINIKFIINRKKGGTSWLSD